MDKSEFEEKIIKPLEAWSQLGEVTNDMGTRLIGHVPHIAPKAYLHVVYAPSDSEEFAELDERLGRPVPAQLKRFFEFTNGMMIFSGSIRVMGFVPHKRKAEVHVYNYPSDIETPNSGARIKGLRDDAVVVGFYKHGGSYAVIDSDGSVARFDPKGIGKLIQEWPDFDTWLFSEIERLSEYFDENGKMTADPKEIFAAN